MEEKMAEMMFAVFLIFWVIVFPFLLISGILALVRMLQYLFGAHKAYIVIPPWLITTFIVGALWPLTAGILYPVYMFFTIYIIFICKSVKGLMNARNQIISVITPTDVVESTEKLILDNNLVYDQWVVETWNKAGKAEWINLLSSNKALLESVLAQKLKIHASSMKPYAQWIEIIQHFIYIKAQENRQPLMGKQ